MHFVLLVQLDLERVGVPLKCMSYSCRFYGLATDWQRFKQFRLLFLDIFSKRNCKSEVFFVRMKKTFIFFLTALWPRKRLLYLQNFALCVLP